MGPTKRPEAPVGYHGGHQLGNLTGALIPQLCTHFPVESNSVFPYSRALFHTSTTISPVVCTVYRSRMRPACPGLSHIDRKYWTPWSQYSSTHFPSFSLVHRSSIFPASPGLSHSP